MRKIDWLVVHTAAADIPGVNARTIRAWHRQRGWSDIGYHYVICDDGEIETGRPIERPGAHARGLNTNSIGVCVTGHGDKRDFNGAQYASLYRLLVRLCYEYDIEAVYVIGHREIATLADAPDPHKTCPGNEVDMCDIRSMVAAKLVEA
ncbi:MAG: N-acetylmuramoyl-L-alanine amidase [Candidatus Lernaella stagnicola]|nr:N-acetylmuramoyl-L-alanine amidase [Candidatus Lernaella stagnicola]